MDSKNKNTTLLLMQGSLWPPESLEKPEGQYDLKRPCQDLPLWNPKAVLWIIKHQWSEKWSHWNSGEKEMGEVSIHSWWNQTTNKRDVVWYLALSIYTVPHKWHNDNRNFVHVKLKLYSCNLKWCFMQTSPLCRAGWDNLYSNTFHRQDRLEGLMTAVLQSPKCFFCLVFSARWMQLSH